MNRPLISALMLHTYITDEGTRVDLELFEDRGFRFDLYLGGRWGRFWYEKVAITILGLYLSIVLTVIGVEIFLFQKLEVELIIDNKLLYILICIVLDILIILKVAPKLVSSISKPLQNFWTNFVASRPIKIYNFSNFGYPGENTVFSEYKIPAKYILGLSFDRDRIHVYDFHFDRITIRGTGAFKSEDISEIQSLLTEHLGLEKHTFNKPWNIFEIQYINSDLYRDEYLENVEIGSEVEYNINIQRNQDKNNPSNHLVISLVWIAILFQLNVFFMAGTFSAYDQGALWWFAVNLGSEIFFAIHLAFAFQFLDYFNAEGSIYNT